MENGSTALSERFTALEISLEFVRGHPYSLLMSYDFSRPPQLQARPTPWSHNKGLQAVLEYWRSEPKHQRNFSLDTTLAARHEVSAAFPQHLHPNIVDAMRRRGIASLYAHQTQAYDAIMRGEHLVVATPTASGKSLCYNLPILQQLHGDAQMRALYLFPTKALARDQEAAVRALMTESGLAIGAITYDGDTPADARRVARDKSNLILSNPDMLHSGILPHHTAWARLFANLKYVVVDELHMYRGVFGSHLANVLRRLQRIARFHGASPQFIFASATIGNPQEHGEQMLGQKVTYIGESGAPAGERHVLLYNPPVINAELGLRASYIKTAVRLALDLIRAEVPTLIFAQSRNNVEVILKYLRDKLALEHIDASAIVSYRGGYLPNVRREIEQGLRSGKLRCVISTNALELGIDIGALDAVICAGYPGSMSALWQRFGRGGRRGAPSLALLVASSAPLDQYFAMQSASLVQSPMEQARIDPDNIEILVQHLKCGAFELPFEQGESFGSVPSEAVNDALGFLTQHRVVHPVQGKNGKTTYHWAADAYPANSVSLRSAAWDNFVVIDVEKNITIAEMDWRSTHTMLHEQAIYQHMAEQFQVERLDYDNHKAFVRLVDSDYYTDAMTHTKISVLETTQTATLSSTLGVDLVCSLGDISLVEKVVGYKKIKYHTHENVGFGEVNLPEMQMHTTAFWITVPPQMIQQIPVTRAETIDALRGLASALRTVAAVGLMIDRRDLGDTLEEQLDLDGAPERQTPALAAEFAPSLFLFDRIAGGVGLAQRLFEEREELLQRAKALIVGCPCERGCPGCIGPTAESAVNRKQLILSFLDMIHCRVLH